MSRIRFAPEQAERRLYWLMLGVAVPGVAAAFLLKGWRGALGFLLGAGLSVLSFRRIVSVVTGIAKAAASQGQEPPTKPSVRLAVLRYLALAAVVYVIVKYFEVNLMAALLGLFVVVAAVLVEILLELMFP